MKKAIALLALLAGAAQGFIPGALPRCLEILHKASNAGVLAHSSHGRHPVRSRMALRMSDQSTDQEMEELLKKRVAILKEKEV